MRKAPFWSYLDPFLEIESSIWSKKGPEGLGKSELIGSPTQVRKAPFWSYLDPFLEI